MPQELELDTSDFGRTPKKRRGRPKKQEQEVEVVTPTKLSVVTEGEESANLAVENHLERSQNLVTALNGKVGDRLSNVEQQLSSLMSGELTVDQLVASYGELSLAEANQAKEQLSRVLNSVEVGLAKTEVEKASIKLKTEQALVSLEALRSGFRVQAASEKTADAQDEALYQADKRETKNEARQEDIGFRRDRNRLTKEDNQDTLEHQKDMNDIQSQFRGSIREGATSRLEAKQFKTQQQVSKTEKLINKQPVPKERQQ